jgi:hypothetical protein
MTIIITMEIYDFTVSGSGIHFLVTANHKMDLIQSSARR